MKAAWSAIKAKNDYFHNRIFRGIVLAEVRIPEFLNIKVDDLEAKREAALKERLTRMPALFDAIKKSLAMEPHQVEIVPIAKQP